ncbi:MAG: hypothetical protein ACLU8D_09065 [Enterocloster sp.]
MPLPFERAGYPVYDRTNFKYYPLGDDFFPDLLEDVRQQNGSYS